MDFFDFDNDEFENADEIKELIQQFEESVKRNKLTFFDQDDFESIIDYYEDIGQFEKALNATQQALTIHPNSATLILRKAHLIFQLKDIDTAFELIELIHTIDATEIGAYILKAEILTSQSRYKEALDILKNLEKTANKEDLTDIYLQICDIYEDTSRYEYVFKYLKKCIGLNPYENEALNRINYCIEVTQLYEESIVFFQEMIDKHPYNYHLWYNLGCSYKGLGLTEKAIEAYEYVVAISEDEDYAYIDMIELLIQEKNITKALEVINDLIEVYEPDEEVFILQGRCFEEQGNYKLARYYYKKALHQDPSLSYIYFKIGETYKKEGLWEQAYQAFLKASDSEKEMYEFHLALVESAIEINEYEIAIDACEAAIETYVNKEDAYYLMAKIFCNLNDYETAREIIINGINACKEHTQLDYANIVILFLQKKHKETENQLRFLLENGNSSEIQYLYRFCPELNENMSFQSIINSIL